MEYVLAPHSLKDRKLALLLFLLESKNELFPVLLLLIFLFQVLLRARRFSISTSVLRESRISIYFDFRPDDMHTDLVLGTSQACFFQSGCKEWKGLSQGVRVAALFVILHDSFRILCSDSGSVPTPYLKIDHSVMPYRHFQCLALSSICLLTFLHTLTLLPTRQTLEKSPSPPQLRWRCQYCAYSLNSSSFLRPGEKRDIRLSSN